MDCLMRGLVPGGRVRDSSVKPGAAAAELMLKSLERNFSRREDLQRMARPAGARHCWLVGLGRLHAAPSLPAADQGLEANSNTQRSQCMRQDYWDGSPTGARRPQLSGPPDAYGERFKMLMLLYPLSVFSGTGCFPTTIQRSTNAQHSAKPAGCPRPERSGARRCARSRGRSDRYSG
jgi:hypothetical protein